MQACQFNIEDANHLSYNVGAFNWLECAKRAVDCSEEKAKRRPFSAYS